MQYEPKPHQKIALDFLREHDRAALFLDMGLGKTVVTLTRMQELHYDFSIHRALVIAPKRVAEDTWSREVEKWDHLKHLRVSKILGTAAQRENAIRENADLYVINRENIGWLVDNVKRWPFDMVIIDELSSFKSPTSQRFRALRRVIGLARYVIGLTGTPASNGYLDLFSEMYLIDNGERLGRFITKYRATYFDAGRRKGNIVYEWKLKPHAKDRIDRLLSDVCLSMSKDDWLKLPPIMFNSVPVRMSSKERFIYDKMIEDNVLPLWKGKLSTFDQMDSAVVGQNAATVSGKLLQMANGAVYDSEGEAVLIHDHKLEALESVIEEAHGSPVLVFYNYRHDLERLKEKFPHGKELQGSDMISAWNRGDIQLLFVHPASAGHGLNLQNGGHIAVWFGLTWSLELYMQANARLHRQGQESAVMVHHIITEGTIDERVLQALHDKDATQQSLLNALKGYLG